MTVLGIVVFAVGLLFSIAWHELGHLSTAKLFGIRVPQYMVGFGPTIWSRKKGDTEYGIKAIPLGGYIRMIGMFPPGADGRIEARSTSPWRSMIEDARSAAFEELQPGDENAALLHAQAVEARHRDVRRTVHEPDPGRRDLPRRRRWASASMTQTTEVASVQRLRDLAEREAATRPAGRATRCRPPRPPGLKAGDKIVAFNGKPVEGLVARSPT